MFNPEILRPSSDDKEEMKENVHLIRKEYYRSIEVDAGSMTVMKQNIPHFGPANLSTLCPRVVLFSMIGLSANPHQDSYQYFGWQFVEEAYQDDSNQTEFIQALLDNKEYDPISHYSDSEVQLQVKLLLYEYGVAEQYGLKAADIRTLKKVSEEK